MFLLVAPGKIKLDASIESEQELERINLILDRIIHDRKVISIYLTGIEKLIQYDASLTIIDKIVKAHIGVEVYIEPEKIELSSYQALLEKCDFVNLNITSGNAKILTENELDKYNAVVRLIFYVNKNNFAVLEEKEKYFYAYRDKFSEIYVKPDFNQKLEGEQVQEFVEYMEDISIDIIEMSVDYSEDYSVVYVDESDSIRNMLHDKMISSDYYVDKNGDVFISEYVHVKCGNIISEDLVLIWDKIRMFWHMAQVKKYFKDFNSLIEWNKYSCLATNVALEEILSYEI
ncbi:hypothetical protein [[Clostridium] polysaccharolyticum]|uniref:Uncharacterized protein n=1 Tax=[Clostridium] polysaccharolyticum TaxID=29364 RepID=A0A1I0DQG4_9FIRM|nr:hypothetical protein [[Clostridium] polysaccharolyticum]SET34611.1 hypothetical protein SAMN04487772_1166 [[Clostridium] polysaccharolyticum]